MQDLTCFLTAVLGFFIGCWKFGLTEIFIQDSDLRKKVHIHSITVTLILVMFTLVTTFKA